MLHHDEVYQIQLVNVINHLLLMIIFLLKHYVQIEQLKEARIIKLYIIYDDVWDDYKWVDEGKER